MAADGYRAIRCPFWAPDEVRSIEYELEEAPKRLGGNTEGYRIFENRILWPDYNSAKPICRGCYYTLRR